MGIVGGVSKSAANDNYPIRESVIIFENGTAQEGMKMPTDMTDYQSCSTQLENGTIFVVPASAGWICADTVHNIQSSPSN